jgi:hypothetical protein
MGYSIGSAVDVRMSKYVEGGVRWSPSARPDPYVVRRRIPTSLSGYAGME